MSGMAEVEGVKMCPHGQRLSDLWCVACLRAENARLQEAEEGRAALRVEFDAMTEQAEKAIEMGKQVTIESDGYKALAELRGEALEPYAEQHCERGVPVPCPDFYDPWGTLSDFQMCKPCTARAAIDATPAEAREKERKTT